MNSRTLRRSQGQVRSALEDVMETIERGAATLGEAAEKAGEEARTELAVLPEQLADARFLDITADRRITLTGKGVLFGRFVTGGRRLFGIASAN